MKAHSVVLVGVLATVAAVPRSLNAQQYPQYGATAAGSNAADLRSAVGQVFTLGNQARAQAGVPSLQWDPALAAAALQHCRRMAAEGPIAHRYGGEPDVAARAAQSGAHFSLIEENVAVAPTARTIHDGWMHSPGHRANMLNPAVDHVGIALVYTRGVLYAVADYSAAVRSLSPAQIEARVASLVRASGVSILPDSATARSMCENNSVLPPESGAPPVWMIRWQNSDLSQLPPELSSRLRSGKYRQAAVGSCPAQENNGAFMSYRVAVLLY
ncbi:MAG: CAP domain-containing protein [Terracidiphilus sp.]